MRQYYARSVTRLSLRFLFIERAINFTKFLPTKVWRVEQNLPSNNNLTYDRCAPKLWQPHVDHIWKVLFQCRRDGARGSPRYWIIRP